LTAFLEDKFGFGAIKMPVFSDFVFKLEDSSKCRSGFKVCKFMVPHRVGLKAVFGDTAVDKESGHLIVSVFGTVIMWWIAWPSQGSVRGQCGGWSGHPFSWYSYAIAALAGNSQCSHSGPGPEWLVRHHRPTEPSLMIASHSNPQSSRLYPITFASDGLE
jgi:hypothetical protein